MVQSGHNGGMNFTSHQMNIWRGLMTCNYSLLILIFIAVGALPRIDECVEEENRK